MKLPRRKFLHLAAGAAALLAMPHIARAQAYPTKPITIVVPFPAGGPTDVLARILGERMRTSLGQPFVIENVSGAAGSLGVARIARAAPDGYMLSIGHLGTHVINSATQTVSYDVLKDLEPVSLLVDNPMVIGGRKDFPAKDLKELITLLKRKPGTVTVGIAGTGGVSDVVGTLFQNATGTSFQFVPYRGAAPLMQDLIAGQIDLTITQVASLLEPVRAGQLKAYVVMADQRWEALPDVPTTDESAVSGVHASLWHGLWVPKATPKAVIARLSAAVVEAFADRTVRQRLAPLGQEIFPRDQQTPEALASLHKSEVEKWWPIIKAAGIKAE
jgi:tripartite-type tricarboxylate transporter receptor subunit TctC